MELTRKARQLLIAVCFLPLTAYGTITITSRGTGGNITSEASTAMAPTSTIAAGTTGVLSIAADNANANTRNFPLDITDSVGNAWHLFCNKPMTGTNTSLEIAVYACSKLATQLTSANNVTVTYVGASVTAKCYTFTELAPSAGNIVLPTENRNQTFTAATAATLATTLSNVIPGNVVLGMVGCENGTNSLVGDSDTVNGTWSAGQTTQVGTTTSGMSIISQTKIQTTATSSQTYDVTFASNDAAIGILNFKETGDAARLVQVLPTSPASNTWVLNPDKKLSAGSMGVLCLATPNLGASGTTKVCPTVSFTDSVGNTWTPRLTALWNVSGPGTASELGLYTAPINTQLTPNDSITVTWDAAASIGIHNAVIYEFVPNAGSTFAYYAGAIGTAANSAAPTVTTGTQDVGDVVIGLLSAEDPDTSVADADTSNGSWSGMTTSTTGAATGTDQSLSSQYKIVTGSGTQTYNPTLTAADVIIGYIAIRQASSQSATNGFFLWQ